MSQDEFDLCDVGSFKKILAANPDMIFLVTKQGCGLCPTIREAADQVGDSRQLPVLELEIKSNGDGPCELLDKELKTGTAVGMAVVFKGGKEVGRRKTTGFVEHDKKGLEKLLS